MVLNTSGSPNRLQTCDPPVSAILVIRGQVPKQPPPPPPPPPGGARAGCGDVWCHLFFWSLLHFLCSVFIAYICSCTCLSGPAPGRGWWGGGVCPLDQWMTWELGALFLQIVECSLFLQTSSGAPRLPLWLWEWLLPWLGPFHGQRALYPA